MLIPKSFYVPEGGVRLISSQHWEQIQHNFKPRLGTMETTNHLSITLYWKQRKYKNTAMLNKHKNVVAFWLAPGLRQFEIYEATVGFNKLSDSHRFISEKVHIIEDDETSYCKSTNQ